MVMIVLKFLEIEVVVVDIYVSRINACNINCLPVFERLSFFLKLIHETDRVLHSLY